MTDAAAPNADLDEVGVNASAEPHFRDVLERKLARRGLLRGALGAAVSTAALGSLGAVVPAPTTRQALAAGGSTLTFWEVPHGPTPDHAVAQGYDARVLIRWGDKVLPDAPPFDPLNQTADAQAKQFGFNNDYQAFMPLPRGSSESNRGLLFLNHEYPDAVMTFPGMDPKTAPERLTREQAAIEMQAVGGSVIEVERGAEGWRVLHGPLNHRITATTPMRVGGPAAGDARMRTNADPSGTEVLGMIGNCAGGVTPWGTVLTCEENFDLYFIGAAGQGPEAEPRKRMGLTGQMRYGWGRFVDRFVLDKEPNEPNRFGWVVEVDPYDPQSVPVKRTALGRIKREGAETALTPDGRVVVYSGDDQRLEYVYRFVTRDRYDPADRTAAMRLLDEGTLSVARFDEEAVTWLPLVHGQGPLTAANGFRGQADVVIDVRRAADLLGATPMDRPEDIEPNPVTGKVYVALTNNNLRRPNQLDRANPRAVNLYGQILEMTPPMRDGKPDHAADSYAWEMFLLAGDPSNPDHKARYGGALSPSGWLACPDNLAFDSRGRMWIASDQGEQQQRYGIGDGMWACDTEGPGRAVTRMFYRTPSGGEMCGPAFTPDDRTLFLAVQHPAGDDAGSTYDKPSTRWPDFQEGMPPRPSVVVVTKRDGGVIGS